MTLTKCPPRTNVRHIVNGSLQRQHGHIEAIGLRREFEVRMHIDLAHTERVRGQRLDGRIDHIIAERDVHLARTGAGHTVAGRHDVLARDQRTAASRNQRPVRERRKSDEVGSRRKRGGGVEVGMEMIDGWAKERDGGQSTHTVST